MFAPPTKETHEFEKKALVFVFFLNNSNRLPCELADGNCTPQAVLFDRRILMPTILSHVGSIRVDEITCFET